MPGTQGWLLSAKPFLMLLVKANGSFLYGENTMILPCFLIYFLLPWITVIDILVSPTLLGSV